MQKIPLNIAQPGMVLAKPVARPDGMVVAAPGTELSEALLARIESMGIDKVTVEGAPVDMDGPAGDTAFDKRLERMDHVFRRYAGDKWMTQIKQLMKHYFKMKAAEQAARVAAAKAAAEAKAKAEAAERLGEDAASGVEGAADG